MPSNKRIIATTLSGLFLKKEPWKVAHLVWFDEASQKIHDPTIKNLAHDTNYFRHVDEIMKKLYPKLTEEKRTIKARESFFDTVCRYIEQNPWMVREDFVGYFESLKDKYRIALITTNTQAALNAIFEVTFLGSLFDLIETSQENEKDDKTAVFSRFIQKHGKPILYVGGDRKESFDFCRENNIPAIFANLENQDTIPGVDQVHSLEELKLIVNHLIS